MRAELHRRLVNLPSADRVRVWDAVDAAHPRPKDRDWREWLDELLDRAITEVRAGKRAQAAPRGACAGSGRAPSEVRVQIRKYTQTGTGKLHTMPGRGTCAECGRESAFTDNGIRRHRASARAVA